jgi:hypothetical protein
MSAGSANPVLITDPSQLEGAVGLPVILRGVVSNSKLPTLVGVDIESSHPDLRGREATASGWLRKTVVTQEELDRELKEKGIFAYRGPGTFYQLVDANGWLVQVRPLP